MHRPTQGPRRFAPLYPGEEPQCPNGCHDYPQRAVMPGAYPPRGWLGACCASCGWTCLFRLRYGDRAEDVCWIIDEDVPHERECAMRAAVVASLRRRGYPAPAWAD